MTRREQPDTGIVSGLYGIIKMNLLKLNHKDIFADEAVNRERQTEFDVLRVILIFIMIAIHIGEVFFSRVWEDNYYIISSDGFRVFDIYVNAVDAFAFMFAMGVSMHFSAHNEPRLLYARGLKLILIWFLLKAAYIYPLGVLFAASKNMSMEQFCLCFVFNSDILFFAGMFLIYCGLIKQFEVSDMGFALITLVLFMCGHFFYFKSDSILLQNLMGQFVWTDATCFPFLNWIMAPFLGLLWGKMLIRCKNKNALYSVLGIVSALVLIMFIKSMDIMGLFTPKHIEEYAGVNFFYRSTLLTVIFSCACLGILICPCYLISTLLSEKMKKAAAYISSHVNEIYILQWLIIPWSALLLPRPTEKYPYTVVIVMAAVVFTLCILLTRVIRARRIRELFSRKH